MLIICSGPDTFRALQKARELEAAFKQKYDAGGLSIERIASGKDAVTEIAARAGAISLFAPRRFVRTAQVLSEASKAQRTTLKKALAGDQDGFILLTIEDEPPSATTLKELGEVKTVRYDFPVMQPAAFMKWALEEAKRMGLQDEKSVRAIVEATEGDTWRCYSEMMKRAAWGGSETIAMDNEKSMFAFADAYVRGQSFWLDLIGDSSLEKQMLTTFLSQARAAVRVRDGATEGIHSFVARKLQGQSLGKADEALARLIEGFFLQRSGYADEKEVTSVL